MGALYVEVGGKEYRYYDNGGTIHAPNGEIIGTLDEFERARSDRVIEWRVRAIVGAHQRGEAEAPRIGTLDTFFDAVERRRGEAEA